MASELPLVIDERLLCCPLCMSSYQQPVILPCLHTFCRGCLEVHHTNVQKDVTEQTATNEQLTDAEIHQEDSVKALPDLIKQHIPQKRIGLPSNVKCPPVVKNELDASSDDGRVRKIKVNELEGQSGQPQVAPRSRTRPPVPHKPAGLVIPPYPSQASKKNAAQMVPPVSAAGSVACQSTTEICPPTLPPRTVMKTPLPAEVAANTVISNTASPPGVETFRALPAEVPCKTPTGQGAPQPSDVGEDMDGYYEVCEQIYEEVENGPDNVKDGEGGYYSIPEPGQANLRFDPNVDYIEPVKTIIDEDPLKIKNKDPITEERAVSRPEVTPKQQMGNFLSNLFRRKTSDKGKARNGDMTDLCGIGELPLPPRGEHSPYSPSPSLSLKSMQRAPIPTPEDCSERCTPPRDGNNGMSTPSNDSAGFTTPVNLQPSSSSTSQHSGVDTPDGTPALKLHANLQLLQLPQLPKRNILSSPSLISAVMSPSQSSSSLTGTHSVPLSLPPNPLVAKAEATEVNLPSMLHPSPSTLAQTTNLLALPFSRNPMILNHSDMPVNDTSQKSQSYSELTINCPMCSMGFAIPATGIKGLKENSFMTSLQEVVLTQSSSEKQCSNCDTSPATFRCLDCHHYLCSGCRNAHNWLKITKTHRVMTLGELQSGRYQNELTQKHEIKCDIHTQNKVELMCLYCDKPICSECKIGEHCDHRVGNLSEAADRDRDLLKSLVDSVQTQMMLFQNTKEDVIQYQAQCGNEKKELIECLRHQHDTIIEAVDEAFSDLVEEIEGAYAGELSSAGSVESQVESIMAHMKHNCQSTEQLLVHGKTEDILVMSKMTKANLNEFSFAKPFELDTRPYVQYSPADFHKSMLLPLFGRLAKRRSGIVQLKHVTQEKDSQRRSADEEAMLLHSFRSRTLNDSLGCKPSGLTLSMNDDIVIVDDTNKKVKVFDPSGIIKMELQPTGKNSFVDPWDVTITYQGYLAVTDKGARCVKVFNSHGQFIHEFGPHLKSPWGIAANSHGHLIVTDILVKTVFVHDTEGNLLHRIECKGHDNLFICPEYVMVNHNDDIIVSDFVKHCITVFDSQGRFLFRYGTRGNQVHQFTTACGIGVDGLGHILVADYTNNRVHKLTRDGQFVQLILSAKQGITAPQTLSVNSQGHLVLIDGTNIKTFRLPSDLRTDSDSDTDPNYEPLQFSNKMYEGTRIHFSRLISDSEA